VQQDRRLVPEHQQLVQAVQQRVVERVVHERQEVLEVPVAHVGDVEADQPDHDEDDPLAGPVLVDDALRMRPERAHPVP
jgi:hypothetical protein